MEACGPKISAAHTGLDPTIAFRFLRACTKIGLVTCRDGRLFHATSRLRVLDGDTPGSLRHLAMLFGTPSQFLLQTALAAALSSPAERNAKGLGAPYSTTTPSIPMKPRSSAPRCRPAHSASRTQSFAAWIRLPLIMPSMWVGLTSASAYQTPIRPSGRLRKKIQRQPRYVVMAPPTGGPSAGATRPDKPHRK
jgi:hypothetical protein